MKRYQYDRKIFARLMGVLLLISPNGYAKDVELIKLSDSVREVQLNMADQESHNLYKTVAYQGTCSKTEYRDDWVCHNTYEQECGYQNVCEQRPVQVCDRGASLFSFSLFDIANAQEAEEQPPVQSEPPPPEPAPQPEPPRPEPVPEPMPQPEPQRPEPISQPEPMPQPEPQRPEPISQPEPQRPQPIPEPMPQPEPQRPSEPLPIPQRPDRPDRPDFPRPDRPDKPDRPDRPDFPRPDRPDRPQPTPQPEPPRPTPVPQPEPTPQPQPPRPQPVPPRPVPTPTPTPTPKPPERPDRPDHPRPPDRPDRPDRPDHPRPPHKPDHPRPRPDRPVCYTKYVTQCENHYKCHDVPTQKCGYESVPYEVPYSCTKYKDVVVGTELDFNIQGLAKVTLAARERVGNEEAFQVALDGTALSLTQPQVSRANLVMLTKLGSQSQILKPDQGPKNPGLKQVVEEIEVGLIPVRSLATELNQPVVETSIRENVLSFVLQRGLYADLMNVRMKLVLDRLIDKTLMDAAVPVQAVSIERYGESAKISIDLSKLALKEKVARGKKYIISLQLGATLPTSATVLNSELIPKAVVKPAVKLKAQ